MCAYSRPHQRLPAAYSSGRPLRRLAPVMASRQRRPHELPAHGLGAAGVPGEPRGARHAIAFRAPTSESGQKGNNASVISCVRTLAACKRWLPGPSASIRGTPMGHGLPAPTTFGAGSPPVSSAFRQQCLGSPSYLADFPSGIAPGDHGAGGMLAATHARSRRESRYKRPNSQSRGGEPRWLSAGQTECRGATAARDGRRAAGREETPRKRN